MAPYLTSSRPQSHRRHRGPTLTSRAVSMKRRRGNPDWGKQLASIPHGPSQFELLVERLGLDEREYLHSTRLKNWVRRNKGQRYVPPDLLKAWDLTEENER